MIIIAGGDSFVFGAELSDQIGGRPSKLSYPALLAKENNFEYQCSAWPGNANSAISRMTMTACEHARKNSSVGVIVMWSFTNRYEFRWNYNTLQKLSPWHSINAWNTLENIDTIASEYVSKDKEILGDQLRHLKRAEQTGIAEFAKVFFKHVGNNEYYELYNSLKEIVFLQNYLKTNNIPYMFVPADNYFYQHPNYDRQRDQYIDTLYNQIDWNKWFFFPEGIAANETRTARGFYQWAVENKYPVGTTHPLEEAHAAAAELLKEKFNELVTQFNKSN